MTEKIKEETVAPVVEEKKDTNFDVVKKVLMPNAVDAAQLLNVKMPSRQKREEMSALVKLGVNAGPCAFCWRAHAKGVATEFDCIHYRHPLNTCRNNILKWMNLEVDAKIPREWLNAVKTEEAKED